MVKENAIYYRLIKMKFSKDHLFLEFQLAFLGMGAPVQKIISVMKDIWIKDKRKVSVNAVKRTDKRS